MQSLKTSQTLLYLSSPPSEVSFHHLHFTAFKLRKEEQHSLFPEHTLILAEQVPSKNCISGITL